MIDITNNIPATNYSKDRKGYKPEAIVLHITGDSNKGQAVAWFEDSSAQVSAHYVIEKDGTIYLCVNPAYRAFHCGIVNSPKAQIYFDMNSVNPNNYTIGIECVSSGEPLTDKQYESLVKLINDLCDSYKIPKDCYHIIGHNELDSINRKFDPVSSYSVKDILDRLVVNVTIEEAIQILVDEGVTNSAEYRQKVCDTVMYEKDFVINVAKKIKELKGA
jgi:N-acetyl-anhydromuramyl-L-alanine amidase AmpD